MRIVNRRAGGYLLNEEDEVELFEYWLLSVDEEYAMARWVMDVLCLQWIDTKPAFQRFMFGLFIRKAEGKDFATNHFSKLADYMDRKIGPNTDETYRDLLPPLPDLKENGKSIVVPDDRRNDYQNWYRNTIRRAWHETWDIHPHMRSRAGVLVFPGEAPDESFQKLQRGREAAFWAEVDAKQREYDCSRSEAIKAVSDYMPRAIDTHRFHDPLND